jgi:four helix bundle suffix protein
LAKPNSTDNWGKGLDNEKSNLTLVDGKGHPGPGKCRGQSHRGPAPAWHTIGRLAQRRGDFDPCFGSRRIARSADSENSPASQPQMCPKGTSRAPNGNEEVPNNLEELLGDYRDFLRQRGLSEWGKNHPMAGVVRRLAYAQNRSYRTYSTYIENAPPEVAANTMLCLVHQTNYLLDQQLLQLEQSFLEKGGFTERLYQARQQARSLPPRPAFGRPNRKLAGAAPNPKGQNYPPLSKQGAPAPRPRPHP